MRGFFPPHLLHALMRGAYTQEQLYLYFIISIAFYVTCVGSQAITPDGDRCHAQCDVTIQRRFYRTDDP
jgi:hypothetical protein